MSGSENVKVDSDTISSAENLSAQEMLYVLLNSIKIMELREKAN
jgi:hypothetical protein